MICRNVGKRNRHFPAGILTASSFLLLPKCPVCAGAMLAAAGVALPVDGALLWVVSFSLFAASVLLFAAALREGLLTVSSSIAAVFPVGVLLVAARWAPAALWPGVAGLLIVAVALAWRRRGKCSRGCASEFH
jgi:hypothetical protein